MGGPKEGHQFSAVFAHNNDNLNSKTSNYYTVINQTLASQVASSMNETSFIPGEIVAGHALNAHY